MKPAPFTYHAPESVDDVCALLAEYGDDAKVLAGGQSLVPILALRLARFDHLVDINRVSELDGSKRANGSLVVGAITRQRAMERDRDVPLLARATPLVGHFQIRNRGTVGGSLAHADPASEYPAVAVALGADLELTRAGGARRSVPAKDFFVATWTTATAPDELLTSARFPVWEGPCGYAIEEVARRHGDFAIAGVACAVGPNRAGLALFGVAPTPFAPDAAVAALADGVPPAEIAELAVRDLEPADDIHATAATRRTIARHLVERAVTHAREEARAAG